MPPPEGAGLAARYSEDHLTRLRLIPIYRQQGLRLDDIRARFNQMDPEALRQAWQKAGGRAGPDAGQAAQAAKNLIRMRPSMPYPAPETPKIIREHFITPADLDGSLSEERFTQYSLPAGIRLVVPDALSLSDRQRVQMLIQAARQIFSAAGGGFYASGDQPTNEAPDPEEE